MQILDELSLASNIKFYFVENTLIGDVGLAGKTVASGRMTYGFKMCWKTNRIPCTKALHWL